MDSLEHATPAVLERCAVLSLSNAQSLAARAGSAVVLVLFQIFANVLEAHEVADVDTWMHSVFLVDFPPDKSRHALPDAFPAVFGHLLQRPSTAEINGTADLEEPTNPPVTLSSI
jgi:hypothetical protein